MKYSKEVVEARKVFDDLVIEQREGKKQLEAVRAEIRAKLDGKPSPHKFEDLKKQEAKLEARLADLPALIADARDAMIAALREYQKEMREKGVGLRDLRKQVIFDRLSSSGDSKERTALKDKTFGAVLLVEYIIYIVPTVLLTPRSLLQLQVTLLESIWE